VILSFRLFQSDIVTHPKPGAYKRRAVRIHSEERAYNDATDVCHFWYLNERGVLVNPLTLSIRGRARTQKGYETAKTSVGVVARESAMLGGPMRHTEMGLIGLFLAGVFASTKPIVAHAVPLGSDIELSHWPVAGFPLI
jgi:hypothetical protein